MLKGSVKYHPVPRPTMPAATAKRPRLVRVPAEVPVEDKNVPTTENIPAKETDPADVDGGLYDREAEGEVLVEMLNPTALNNSHDWNGEWL